MITKEHNSVIHNFKNDLCKLIVIYMKENNIPMSSIFKEDVLNIVTKCSNIYDQLLSWSPKDPEDSERWYTSQKHILKQVDSTDGIVYYSKLTFTYDSIKGLLFKNYITHKICWR